MTQHTILEIGYHALHLYQINHCSHVHWCITPIDVQHPSEDDILDEGDQPTPRLAVKAGRSAIYNLSGIRE